MVVKRVVKMVMMMVEVSAYMWDKKKAARKAVQLAAL